MLIISAQAAQYHNADSLSISIDPPLAKFKQDLVLLWTYLYFCRKKTFRLKTILKRIIFIILSVLSSCTFTFASDKQDSHDTKPVIGGAFRSRFEYDITNQTHRFQIRNARVSIAGNISPVIGYYAKVDMCDRGNIKFLDAYGRFLLTDWLRIQAGRQSIPFSVDASRSPGTYYFSGHSFVEEFVGQIRGVGLQGFLTIPKSKIYIDTGIFQMHGTDQSSWTTRFDYVGRLGWKSESFKCEIGIESTVVDSTRINMYDASVSWRYGRWMVECEGLVKSYTHNRFNTAWAYNAILDYVIPLPKFTFHQCSFQSRFDRMSHHSNGIRNDIGILTADSPQQSRLTLGTTLTYLHSGLKTELRINYEKKFADYHCRHQSSGNGNKLIAEIVIIF